MASTATLKTVTRAFEILDRLWERDGATPNELAADLDIPLSTAHSYLHSLAETGYVDRSNGRYQPGYRFFMRGNELKQREPLLHKSKAELRRLADVTEEIAVIHVEYDGLTMILHLEEGPQSIDVGIYPGVAAPLYTQAAGKVLLAHLPEERVHDLVHADLEPVTKETITDPAVLLDELAEIRDRGYWADWDQQVIGAGMVSAPVLIDAESSNDVRGSDVDLLGAITIVSPTGRLRDEEYRSTLVRHVREAADTIGVNYQYGGPRSGSLYVEQ